MAGRKHKSVAVGPGRIGGIEFQELAVKHDRHVGHAHRHARMSAVGGLHGVHGQRADRVGEAAGGRLLRYRGLCCHLVPRSVAQKFRRNIEAGGGRGLSERLTHPSRPVQFRGEFVDRISPQRLWSRGRFVTEAAYDRAWTTRHSGSPVALDRLEQMALPLAQARAQAAKDAAEIAQLREERDSLLARITELEDRSRALASVTEEVEGRLDGAIVEIRAALGR